MGLHVSKINKHYSAQKEKYSLSFISSFNGVYNDVPATLLH